MIPFLLPPDVDSAAWAHALALGGFVAEEAARGDQAAPGDPAGDPPPEADEPPSVRLEAGPDAWLLVVTTAEGARRVPVAPPQTDGEREAVVYLARSLLTGSAPLVTRLRPAAWAGAGFAPRLQASGGASYAARVDAGLGWDRWLVGAWAELVPAAGVPGVEEGRTSSWSAGGAVGWAPARRIAPFAALSLGVGARTWWLAEEPLLVAPSPVAGLDAGGTWSPGRLRVRLGVAATVEGTLTTVRLGDSIVPWAPVAVGPRLAIGVGPEIP